MSETMGLPLLPRQRASAFPVVEIFGPTVQGEGMLAGVPTHFVRLGNCDYRCSWCDSLYAVLPDEVKRNSERLEATTIADRLAELPGSVRWVTLSGGNPAMHDLTALVDLLHERDLLVSVETQGSIWRPWLGTTDALTVSPKPPSSGMVNAKHEKDTKLFFQHANLMMGHDRRSLKIVVFDDTDFEWAVDLLNANSAWRAFLSVGTDPPDAGESLSATRERVCDRYRWLCERVTAADLPNVRVFPQLHVLAWGHARGV